MEVSTFELLIKPIAPRNGLPANVQSGLRRVVQGYFLTISNLEDQDLRFRIEFVDSTPNPANTNRQLSINPRNVDLLFDIAGDNEALIPPSVVFQGGEFGGSFTLPARQTASVQLLPSLTPFIPGGVSQPTPLPSPLNDPNPTLEIRGFVRLRLPANVRIERNPFRVIREPQAEGPVKVLLQPEIRGTFLPNNFPNQPAGDLDQINYSLVTASGKALNEIEPEGPIRVNNDLITTTLQRLEAERELNIERLEEMGELDRAVMVIESLSQLDTSPENLEQVSNLLSRANIPIRMSAV
jgi:hypothetical protein